MAVYTPKLHWYQGDEQLDWYTTWNPYYTANLWMPNCVAWTYARWNQLANTSGPGGWPTGNGAQWFQAGINMGLQYSVSFVPQVGACICWDGPDPDHPDGHVAIIEQLHRPAPGQPVDYVVVSQSFWDDDRTIQPSDSYPFFTTGTVYVNDLNHIYVPNGPTYYQIYQGVLYHPNWPPGVTPDPPTPTPSKHINPIWVANLPNRIRRMKWQ